MHAYNVILYLKKTVTWQPVTWQPANLSYTLSSTLTLALN